MTFSTHLSGLNTALIGASPRLAKKQDFGLGRWPMSILGFTSATSVKGKWRLSFKNEVIVPPILSFFSLPLPYQQDWDETYPYLTACPAHSNPVTDLPQGLLHPYVKNAAVWDCPSAVHMLNPIALVAPDRAQWDPNWNSWFLPPDFAGHWITIGANEVLMPNLGCDWSGGNWGPVVKMSEVRAPAEIIAFADSQTNATCGGNRIPFPNVCSAGCNSDPNHRSVSKHTRHTEGSNIVFADGHAKWVKWEVVANNCWAMVDPRGRPANPYNGARTWFERWGGTWYP